MGSKFHLPWDGDDDAGPAFVSDPEGVDGDGHRFLRLLRRMAPQDRRVIAALMAHVADTEARLGQAAALDLIADIESFIRGSKPGRLN
jgi:hypothetical protein